MAIDSAEVLKGVDLPHSERQALILRLGLDGQEPHGLEEIAEVLGTTGAAAKVLVDNAMVALRARRNDQFTSGASEPSI